MGFAANLSVARTTFLVRSSSDNVRVFLINRDQIQGMSFLPQDQVDPGTRLAVSPVLCDSVRSVYGGDLLSDVLNYIFGHGG